MGGSGGKGFGGLYPIPGITLTVGTSGSVIIFMKLSAPQVSRRPLLACGGTWMERLNAPGSFQLWSSTADLLGNFQLFPHYWLLLGKEYDMGMEVAGNLRTLWMPTRGNLHRESLRIVCWSRIHPIKRRSQVVFSLAVAVDRRVAAVADTQSIIPVLMFLLRVPRT